MKSANITKWVYYKNELIKETAVINISRLKAKYPLNN